jgi:AraC-like DNA-binding protein
MIPCVACGDMRFDTASRRRHATIIKRLSQLEEANRGHPLYLIDACKALRVSQRTLHQICQGYLGVGPKRYFLLRRLHLAHRELEAVSRGQTTVAQVALKYGFWELGRFAVAYRQTFGEPPSATLAIGGCQHRTIFTWPEVMPITP